MKYFEEFLVSLAVTVILSVLVYTGRRIPGLWRKAASRRFRKVIAYETAKHSIVQAMQTTANSKRVALCKAHNGGGVPVPGKDINITIDWEEVDSPLKPIKSEWQSRTPDPGHLKLLLDLTRKREQLVNVKDTVTEVMETHLADGVEYSFMKEIVPTKTAYWYVVLFYDNNKPLSPESKRKLTSLSNNLKKLLSNKATLLELETWARL